jgi:hypothetical protein
MSQLKTISSSASVPWPLKIPSRSMHTRTNGNDFASLSSLRISASTIIKKIQSNSHFPTKADQKLFGGKSNNGKDGDLNDCLLYDELMCGPRFVTCSGSDRRCMVIVSEIDRNGENEQCQEVDVNWAKAVPVQPL